MIGKIALARGCLPLLVVSLTWGCGDSSSADGNGGSAGAAGAPNNTAAPDPAQTGSFLVGATRFTVDHTGVGGVARPLDVVVWYPTADKKGADETLGGALDVSVAGGGYPLIAFSHGLGGIPEQSTFFTTFMASHGYVVVAMSHPGSTISDPIMGEGVAAAFVNRPGDVLAAVDAVVARSDDNGDLLSGSVDPSRMGVSGHSFGAWTTLAVMALDDHPFLAGIPMAPPSPEITPVEIANIGQEVMIMGATEDSLAVYPGAVLAFERLSPDKRWLLTFPGADHFAYSDPCLAGCEGYDQDTAHRMINTYGAAFLMKFVGGEDGLDTYLETDTNIEDGAGILEAGTHTPL